MRRSTWYSYLPKKRRTPQGPQFDLVLTDKIKETLDWVFIHKITHVSEPFYNPGPIRYPKQARDFQSWRITKGLIEKEIDVVIKVYRDSKKDDLAIYYFDIGVGFDIERVYFHNLVDRILIERLPISNASRIFHLLSTHFIVRFVGENNLIEIIPYQNFAKNHMSYEKSH